METLVLIPPEFGLAPTSGQDGYVSRCVAVHSEQYVARGTRFLPFEGTVRLGRLHLEPFLPEHDVRCKFGSFDMVQELDNNRRIRQCNWVRFLVGTTTTHPNTCSGQQATGGETKHTDMEPNMTAMLVDGQPVFEATKSILPHTLIVVNFKDTIPSASCEGFLVYRGIPVSQNDASPNTTELQDGPLDLSKSLMEPTKPQLFVTSAGGTNNRVRLSQKSLLPCEVCGKVFDRPSLLKRHMRTHTGEKPHICEVCNKGFSTSSSLNTHRRIHSGDKPHQCLVCGKRFTASSNLYYHRMTHTKEKPHKCGQCSKSFPTPGDLKAHMYIHSGSWPFRCNICSRGFSKQTNLRNHLFLHTGDRPYPCKFCGKKFALACNLRAHTKTHHHSDGKINSDKEMSSEKTGITNTAYDSTAPGHEDKLNLNPPRGTSDTNCKIHNTWHEKNDKGTQSILVTAPNKCSLPIPETIQQFPSCSLIKNFHSSDSTESPSETFTDNKRLFHMNSSKCVLDDASKSVTYSDQLHDISRLGYTNILEELWSGNNSFINQYNIPLSVLPAPFNINMPCLTSVSLADLQALLLMQAANMAILHGGNITFNDGKSLKKQMTEPAQSRSLLLA